MNFVNFDFGKSGLNIIGTKNIHQRCKNVISIFNILEISNNKSTVIMTQIM